MFIVRVHFHVCPFPVVMSISLVMPMNMSNSMSISVSVSVFVSMAFFFPVFVLCFNVRVRVRVHVHVHCIKIVIFFSFGLFRNADFFGSVRFETLPKRRNKTKFIFSFLKKTKKKTEQTKFVSVRTEKINLYTMYDKNSWFRYLPYIITTFFFG